MLDTLTQKTLLDPPYRQLVKFPYVQEVKDVLKGFSNFLTEPQSYKDTWSVGEDREEGDPEYGYFRRERVKGDLDNKEALHVRTNLRAMLNEHGTAYARHETFLRACERLHYACISVSREQLLNAAKELSRRKNDGGAFVRDFLERAQRADAQHMPTLRVQQYADKNAAGQVIAARHADKSYATLHVYGSEPGLEFGSDYEGLSDFAPIEVPADYALLFGGRKIAWHTDGTIPALLHQARAWSNRNRVNVVLFDHLDCLAIPRWYPHKNLT